MPDYDRDRFYVSHMRKLSLWYNQLLANNITDFSVPVEEAAEEAVSPGEDEQAVEEK